jgi:hypothetical protein
MPRRGIGEGHGGPSRGSSTHGEAWPCLRCQGFPEGEANPAWKHGFRSLMRPSRIASSTSAMRSRDGRVEARLRIQQPTAHQGSR